jgi:hypothetical protein
MYEQVSIESKILIIRTECVLLKLKETVLLNKIRSPETNICLCIYTLQKQKHVDHTIHVGRTQKNTTLISKCRINSMQGYHKQLSHNFGWLAVEQAPVLLPSDLSIVNEKTANVINLPCGTLVIMSRSTTYVLTWLRSLTLVSYIWQC